MSSSCGQSHILRLYLILAASLTAGQTGFCSFKATGAKGSPSSSLHSHLGPPGYEV